MASGTVDVYVKLPTGRTAQFYVRPSDTIETICGRVAEEEKVKATQVRLKYQGKVLNRTHSMSFLGVRPETILKAEILVARPVTLMVALPNDLGETEVTSTSLDTVSDVINNIADVIKENKSRIKLKYEGREVRGHTLMDAGLVDGSALEVELVEPKPEKKTKGASADKQDIEEDKKQEIIGSFDSAGRPVEVVFSFDTTGSMYSCLDQVRTKLRECCTRLIQDVANIRIGVMAHGDYCDQSNYVIRSVDLTSDVQALVDFVRNVPKTGGGDTPECYEWVLRKAQSLDWSEDSAKALVVIGDAEPHEPDYTDAQVFWKDELSVLTGMGVKVYGVRALNHTTSAPFYEELADVSGGHYLTMNNFDVITDMFLAVCYRESNDNDLEAFAREVEEAGRMNEERREMFQRLENPNPPARQQENQQNARYVRQAWWDPSLSRGNRPEYHYDEQLDKWMSYLTFTRNRDGPSSAGDGHTAAAASPATSSRPVSRAARRQSKKKCSIM